MFSDRRIISLVTLVAFLAPNALSQVVNEPLPTGPGNQAALRVDDSSDDDQLWMPELLLHAELARKIDRCFDTLVEQDCGDLPSSISRLVDFLPDLKLQETARPEELEKRLRSHFSRDAGLDLFQETKFDIDGDGTVNVSDLYPNGDIPFINTLGILPTKSQELFLFFSQANYIDPETGDFGLLLAESARDKVKFQQKWVKYVADFIGSSPFEDMDFDGDRRFTLYDFFTFLNQKIRAAAGARPSEPDPLRPKPDPILIPPGQQSLGKNTKGGSKTNFPGDQPGQSNMTSGSQKNSSSQPLFGRFKSFFSNFDRNGIRNYYDPDPRNRHDCPDCPKGVVFPNANRRCESDLKKGVKRQNSIHCSVVDALQPPDEWKKIPPFFHKLGPTPGNVGMEENGCIVCACGMYGETTSLSCNYSVKKKGDDWKTIVDYFRHAASLLNPPRPSEWPVKCTLEEAQAKGKCPVSAYMKGGCAPPFFTPCIGKPTNGECFLTKNGSGNGTPQERARAMEEAIRRLCGSSAACDEMVRRFGDADGDGLHNLADPINNITNEVNPLAPLPTTGARWFYDTFREGWTVLKNKNGEVVLDRNGDPTRIRVIPEGMSYDAFLALFGMSNNRKALPAFFGDMNGDGFFTFGDVEIAASMRINSAMENIWARLGARFWRALFNSTLTGESLKKALAEILVDVRRERRLLNNLYDFIWTFSNAMTHGGLQDRHNPRLREAVLDIRRVLESFRMRTEGFDELGLAVAARLARLGMEISPIFTLMFESRDLDFGNISLRDGAIHLANLFARMNSFRGFDGRRGLEPTTTIPPPNPENRREAGDPIGTLNGENHHFQPLVVVDGPLGLELGIHYFSHGLYYGQAGMGWDLSINSVMTFHYGKTFIRIQRPDGNQHVYFLDKKERVWTGVNGDFGTIVEVTTPEQTMNGRIPYGSFLYRPVDEEIFEVYCPPHFQDKQVISGLHSYWNTKGYSVLIKKNAAGQAVGLLDSLGREWRFKLNQNIGGVIHSITDFRGRVFEFRYNDDLVQDPLEKKSKVYQKPPALPRLTRINFPKRLLLDEKSHTLSNYVPYVEFKYKNNSFKNKMKHFSTHVANYLTDIVVNDKVEVQFDYYSSGKYAGRTQSYKLGNNKTTVHYLRVPGYFPRYLTTLVHPNRAIESHFHDVKTRQLVQTTVESPQGALYTVKYEYEDPGKDEGDKRLLKIKSETKGSKSTYYEEVEEFEYNTAWKERPGRKAVKAYTYTDSRNKKKRYEVLAFDPVLMRAASYRDERGEIYNRFFAYQEKDRASLEELWFNRKIPIGSDPLIKMSLGEINGFNDREFTFGWGLPKKGESRFGRIEEIKSDTAPTLVSKEVGDSPEKWEERRYVTTTGYNHQGQVVHHKSARGDVTRIEYDSFSGQPDRVVLYEGSNFREPLDYRYGHDENGRINSFEEVGGLRFSFDFDSHGDLIQKTLYPSESHEVSPLGVQYFYNRHDQLAGVSVSTPKEALPVYKSGLRPKLQYLLQNRSDGLAESHTLFVYGPNGSKTDEGVFKYDYYSDGSLKSVSDPLGLTVVAEWDPFWEELVALKTFGKEREFDEKTFLLDDVGRVKSIYSGESSDLAGQSLLVEYKYENERRVETCGGDGVCEKYFYDHLDRIHKTEVRHKNQIIGRSAREFTRYDQITKTRLDHFRIGSDGKAVPVEPKRLVTRFGAGEYGQTAWVLNGTAENPIVKKFHFDPSGRLSQSILGILKKDKVKIDFVYDRNSNIVQATEALLDEGTSSKNDNPKKKVYRRKYDGPLGQLTEKTDPDGYTTRFEYDSLFNQLSSVFDATDAANEFQYDSLNRVVRRTERPQGGKETRAFDFEYDLKSNLLSMTTGSRGEKTRFKYDERGNQVQMIYPDGSAVRTRYDKRSRPIEVVGASGERRRVSWNNNNQITKLEFIRGQERGVRSFRYDVFGREVFAGEEIWKSSKRKSRTWITHEHSSLGYLLGSKYHDGVSEFSNQYSYNAEGLLSEKKNSLQHIEIKYDAFNRVDQVIDKKAARTLAKVLEHYGLQGPARLELNGEINFDVRRNRRGLVSQWLFTKKSEKSPFEGFEVIKYTPLGQIKTRERVGGTEQAFQYHGFGHLNAANYRHEKLPGGEISSQYEFDNIGNLSLHTENNRSTKAEYNELNQLLSFGDEKDFKFDREGREVQRLSNAQEVVRKYDVFGRLQTLKSKSGEVHNFQYLPNDLLAQHTSSRGKSERYFYQGSNIVGKTDTNSNVISYVALPGAHLQSSSQGTSLNLEGMNHSTLYSAGKHFEYLPYGKALVRDSTGFRQAQEQDFQNKKGFWGLMRMAGQYRAENRFYDLSIKRFAKRDPKGYGGGLNLYGSPFDPINFFDPKGLNAEAVQKPGKAAKRAIKEARGLGFVTVVGGRIPKHIRKMAKARIKKRKVSELDTLNELVKMHREWRRSVFTALKYETDQDERDELFRKAAALARALEFLESEILQLKIRIRRFQADLGILQAWATVSGLAAAVASVAEVADHVSNGDTEAATAGVSREATAVGIGILAGIVTKKLQNLWELRKFKKAQIPKPDSIPSTPPKPKVDRDLQEYRPDVEDFGRPYSQGSHHQQDIYRPSGHPDEVIKTQRTSTNARKIRIREMKKFEEIEEYIKKNGLENFSVAKYKSVSIDGVHVTQVRAPGEPMYVINRMRLPDAERRMLDRAWEAYKKMEKDIGGIDTNPGNLMYDRATGRFTIIDI